MLPLLWFSFFIPPEQVSTLWTRPVTELSITGKDEWNKGCRSFTCHAELLRGSQGNTGFHSFVCRMRRSSRGAGVVRRRETSCARPRGILQEMALRVCRDPRVSFPLLSLLRCWLLMSASALEMIDDPPDLICSEVKLDNPQVSY